MGTPLRPIGSPCSSLTHSHPPTFSPTLPSVHSTQRMTCGRYLARSWMPWSIFTGAARSTSTKSLPTSSSALVGLSAGPCRSSLLILRQHRLLPATGHRLREHTTSTMLPPRLSRRQRPILSLTSGPWACFSTSSCPVSCHLRVSLQRRPKNILNVKFKFEYLYKECTMEGTRLLMWVFKKAPIRRPTLEEIGAHRWMNSADYML